MIKELREKIPTFKLNNSNKQTSATQKKWTQP